MSNIYKIKQIIITILILTIVGGIYLSIKYNKTEKNNVAEKNENNIVEEPKIETIDLCYYKSDKTKSQFNDKAWLKLSLTGDKVKGEFQNLPAESDSKIGTFEGTVGPLNQSIMGREANVWWNSMAEGMEVKEELAIQFGDGSATVGFGEMVNRGDGVYVYKNKTNLSWIKSMSQIDCMMLDEKLYVEKYVRDNIKTIATDKPVLGGQWYVSNINVNPSAKTGEVSYEDGHIQSKANFIYSYDQKTENVTINKFEVKK